jgi:hypothetical protein
VGDFNPERDNPVTVCCVDKYTSLLDTLSAITIFGWFVQVAIMEASCQVSDAADVLCTVDHGLFSDVKHGIFLSPRMPGRSGLLSILCVVFLCREDHLHECLCCTIAVFLVSFDILKDLVSQFLGFIAVIVLNFLKVLAYSQKVAVGFVSHCYAPFFSGWAGFPALSGLVYWAR